MTGKFIPAVLFFSILSSGIFAESIGFYATKSDSSDENIVRMMTDMLFTQFTSAQGCTVTDKRQEEYDPETHHGFDIVFYTELDEMADGGWQCVLNAIKSKSGKTVCITKNYDSSYKLLLDAKVSVENILANLRLSGQDSGSQPATAADQRVAKVNSMAMDELAGSWSGEEHIEKILILRGGRGFVVFKNGASMNVTVSSSGGNITIRQNGKANASFFPNLDREAALKAAPEAKPVEWNFTYDGNTLSGKKTTLVQNGTVVSEGSVDVQWTRR